MENENEQTEVLDFTKPDYVFVPNGIHEWRQQGPYIICKSCDLEHGVYVGVQRQLVGIDEKGQPILKTL